MYADESGGRVEAKRVHRVPPVSVITNGAVEDNPPPPDCRGRLNDIAASTNGADDSEMYADVRTTLRMTEGATRGFEFKVVN